MKWNITLPLLASLFVIQNALCSEIPRDIEDVLKRLQHMEDKVAAQGTEIAAQGTEIENLRKTNTELKSSNQDLRTSMAELGKTNTELKRSNQDLCKSMAELRKTNTELKRSNQDLRRSMAELQEAGKENHECHALLFGSNSVQRQFRFENNQKKAFFEKGKYSTTFVSL